MQEKFLTPEEVATHLNLHIMTVWRWIRKGKISSVKVGEGPATRYRIKQSDLLELEKDIYPFLNNDARHSKNKKSK